MRGPAQLATYLAGAFIAAGFVTIYFAWNGAAELNTLAGQFPYLVSGGLAGLALISAGCALWIVQTSRQLSAERARRMQRLDTALVSVVEAFPAEAVSVAAAPVDPDLVVVGRSSFHDPSCHLIASRDDLDRAPRSSAVEAGLTPCRVCKPA
jgi:hypothetical protein